MIPAELGDPHDPDALALQLGVLDPVLFRIARGGMPVTPVELEHELLLRPVAVDLPDPYMDVPERIRDLGMPSQPLVKRDLKSGAALRLRAVDAQSFLELGEAGSTLVAFKRGLDRAEIEDALAHRLGDQPVELAAMLQWGELDQHPRDGADSEAVAHHDLLRIWRLLDPVHRQAWSPPAARGHHGQLDPPGVDLPQSPHRRGRAVGEPRIRANREQRREQPRMRDEPRMPDRVHAAVQGVQPPEADPILNLRVGQPQPDELGERDDPELAGGNPSNSGVNRRRAPASGPARMPFPRHVLEKGIRVGHAAHAAKKNVTGG